MSRTPKLIVLTVGGIIAFLTLAAVALVVVLGGNAKDQVQRLVSEALGMEVNVKGAVNIGFVPRLHVAMHDVQIRNRGSEIATAAQATVGIEFLALLHNEVRMDSVALKQARISIERQKDGRFNFETGPDPAAAPLATSVATVSLSDTTLVYTDRRSGDSLEADACEVDLRQLTLTPNAGSTRRRNLSLTGTLACAETRAAGLVLSDLKSSIDGKNGVFDFKPVTMRILGGQGSGSVQADFSAAAPTYRIKVALSKFQLAQLFKTMSATNVGEGSMDFSATLSMRGMTSQEMLRSTGGQASLSGHDLTLGIGDIDAMLSRYKSSQSFNLVDVGAVLFAGPFGLIVTKGYSFASNFEDSGGSSVIRTLVSDWRIERGSAQAKDVAMATKENRIALKGELDLVNGRFHDVTVAVVDADGCSTVQQKISGPFDKPIVEKPAVLASLAGPVRKLFRQAESLLGGQCDVFYAGSVASPR